MRLKAPAVGVLDPWSVVTAGIRHVITQLGSPSERLFWGYWASSVILAAVAFRKLQERQRGEGFFRYLFPRSVWLHPSARVDYIYVAIVTIVWAGLIAPCLLETSTVKAWVAHIEHGWAHITQSKDAPIPSVVIFYTLTLFVVDDFRRFIVHRLFHRVPLLWEFHKVHHSAQVLTPITLYREHPFEMLLNGVATAVSLGFVTGLFVWWWPQGLTPATILGANLGRFVFDLFGANLRHSHVWLRFGASVEHLIISPAQHQIHHSCDPRHYDRNFGSQLAIWDWLFGTLYVPARHEPLTFGLKAEELQSFTTLPQLLVSPVIGAWKIIWRSASSPIPLQRERPRL